MISDFYAGTTKKFSVTITYFGTTPDIRGDVIRVLFKRTKNDSDGSAAINEVADVVSNGTSGVAKFILSKEVTAVESGEYYYEITWSQGTSGSGEFYVLESGRVTIKDRLTDLP